MDKERVVHVYNEILFNNKEYTIKPCKYTEKLYTIWFQWYNVLEKVKQ